MQNVSIPVPRQNDLFDAEPIPPLSLSEIFSAPEADRNISLSVNERVWIGHIPVCARMAFVVSLLLHIAVAIVLCTRPIQMPIVKENPLQAFWIVWSDPIQSSENGRPSRAALTMPAETDTHLRKDVDPSKPVVRTHSAVTVVKDGENVASQGVLPTGTALKSDAVALQSAFVHDIHKISIQAQVSPTAETQASASLTTAAKPRYRDNTLPVYPPEARRRGQEGVVVVHAEICPKGRIGAVSVKTSSGYSLLDQAALEAVSGWIFEPARRMEKPVAAEVDIPIRFVLKSYR